MLILTTATMPTTTAHQFAGCVDDDELEHAARFVLHDIYDTIFTVTVIGVDDFDPELEIRYDLAGRDTYACQNDTPAGIFYGVELPTAQAGFNDKIAQLGIRFLEEEFPDEPPIDFEIIITEHDRQSGEFVMLYHGASIFGADDVDEVSFFTTEEQMRYVFYAANFNPAEFPLSPEISLVLGTEFSLTCSVSSLADLCDGETVALDGFTVTYDYLQELELSGDDVMLSFTPNLGGEEYLVEIRSQDALTYGPYIFMVHGGVAYPQNGGD